METLEKRKGEWDHVYDFFFYLNQYTNNCDNMKMVQSKKRVLSAGL